MASKKNPRLQRSLRIKNDPELIQSDLVEVRNSPIHGRGVYAAAAIPRGTRIIEYVGERISHSEADRRYALKAEDDGHTFLFVVNHKTVIDGTFNGNDARYINHRCEPNCETVTEGNRIFIEAVRDIKNGEELGYDYQLTWSDEDDPEDLQLYACLCGTKSCRGTMLDRYSVEQNRARERARKRRAKARAEARAGKSVKSKATAKKNAVKKKSGKKQGSKKTGKSKTSAKTGRGGR